MKRKVTKLIIHCSDSPDSLNIGFREINQWHRERGWLDKRSDISCGYHYIVRRNGKIEAGRPESSVGSHTFGHNRESIGICWIGRDKMTPKQDSAIRSLCRKLIEKHGLKPFDIYGHKEFSDKKTCPNIDMDEFRLDVLFTALK